MEPDFQLLDQKYDIYANNGFISLESWTKFLFEVSWMHYCAANMAQAG